MLPELTTERLVCMLVVGAGLAGLLACEATGRRPGVHLFKPLASTGFVALCVVSGGLESAYGRAVLAGLVLSWGGDVLLMPRGRPGLFRLGIGSFLLGHVAFTAAFAARGIDGLASGLTALVLLPAVVVTLRWLAPAVPADFVLPVRAYIAVISTMLVVAVGSFAAAGNALIPTGAALFYVSDLSVARDRFVAEGFVNAAWGLPAYYLAQVLLALSTATG